MRRQSQSMVNWVQNSFHFCLVSRLGAKIRDTLTDRFVYFFADFYKIWSDRGENLCELVFKVCVQVTTFGILASMQALSIRRVRHCLFILCSTERPKAIEVFQFQGGFAPWLPDQSLYQLHIAVLMLFYYLIPDL